MSNSVLKDGYKEAYTSIVMYLSSSGVPSDFMDEVSEDITDLLINAQNDGIDVNHIIVSNNIITILFISYEIYFKYDFYVYS